MSESKPTFQSCSDVFYKDVKPLSSEDVLRKEENVTIPPGLRKEFREFISLFDKNPGLIDWLKKLSDVEKADFSALLESEEFLYPKDYGNREEAPETLVNEPKHNEKDLGIKIALPKNKSGRRSVKIMLKKTLGTGVPVHIPLYHSGFWITVEPLDRAEKVKLFTLISEDINTLGRKTNDIFFSNFSVHISSTIFDFIRSKIVAHSIKLEDGDDLYDFIKIQDIPIILAGVLHSIYPNGAHYTLRCKNNIKVGEDDKPICNFKADVKLDFSRMLWTDLSRLTVPDDETDFDPLEVISNRHPNSVNKETVLKYQQLIDSQVENTLSLEMGDEDNLIRADIVFKTPNLKRYFEAGEYFIELIESQLEDLITTGEVAKDKETAKLELAASVYLSKYIHFVDKVIINGDVYEEFSGINDILSDLTEVTEYKEKIENFVFKVADNTLVAFVGVPTYTCPVCKTSQTEDKTGPFKSFISINMVANFFIRMASQYKKVLSALKTSE